MDLWTVLRERSTVNNREKGPMAFDPALVETIFHRALDRPASERAAYLDQACASEPELRRRVDQLLSAHSSDSSFLAGPPRETAALAEPDLSPIEGPGCRVGRYRILQEIGEGGFGTVFMAEQEEPVRRRVALKIIKLGMDTRQVVARFEAERQALAMMDHPAIAKVLDGGATETGRPYFVMELVKGIPVTEYCDRHNLSVPERLAVFLQVVNAVQHAHQKGLIHRDLKPSNILVSTVDDRPAVKVIDFGIAKATQARLTEKTLFTEFRQVVGTPEYMSPEQCEGNLDVDTRSDIYSLGVLLYELLTGSPPFDPRELRSLAFVEMQRVIREVDPPTPSLKLSTSMERIASLAAHRGTEPRKLHALVRGELDWMVMKALEKDRARRYESASSLAADIMRYLADEPVSAGAPSRIHRLRKFVRRHRGPVIASAAVLAVLIAGTVGTTIGLVGQSRQRQIAELERAEARSQAAIARAVGRFQTEMLASVDPRNLLGDKVTVMDAVLAALKELDAGKLGDQPLVEASVRETIGETLNSLGRHEQAEQTVRAALSIRRRVQGPSHLDTAATLESLGAILEQEGRFEEAEKVLRESVEIRRKAAPGGDTSVGRSLYGLAIVLRDLGRYAEGEQACREALGWHRRSLPPLDRATGKCLSELAVQLQLQGKLKEAEPFYREAVAVLRSALPAGHPDLAEAVTGLGIVLVNVDKCGEAEPLLREALALRRKAYPEGHRDIAASLSNLTYLLERQGRTAEAETLLREAVAINRKALPAGHPDLAADLANLAVVLGQVGNFAEAESLLREALEIDRKVLPAGHPNIARDLATLARVLTHRKNFVEAEALSREGIAIMRKALPAGHADIATCLERLSGILREQRRFSEAEPVVHEALEIRRKAFPEGGAAVSASLDELGQLLEDQGKLAEAEAPLREALAMRKKAFPEGHPFISQTLNRLACVLEEEKKYAEAETLFREAIGCLGKAARKEDRKIGVTRDKLGRVLKKLDRRAEAEAELLEAERLLVAVKDDSPESHRNTISDLVALYEAWEKAEPGKGYQDKAAAWKAKLPPPEPEKEPAAAPPR
jgi:eukaryotic-like serine/threonine-protein kinase